MKKLIIISQIVWLSACAASLEGTTVKKEYSLDGVKHIAVNVVDPYQADSLQQPTYSLATDQRLLLRFEKLNNFINQIRTGSKYRIYIGVTPLDDENSDRAIQTLRLCPLTRNWMILATWTQAVPGVGSPGDWATPGSDYDAENCVTGVLTSSLSKNPNPQSSPSPTPSSSPDDEISANEISFDMTSWFLNNPKGRMGENYGFVLLAPQPVKVFGEKSSNHSPRIRWTE